MHNGITQYDALRHHNGVSQPTHLKTKLRPRNWNSTCSKSSGYFSRITSSTSHVASSVLWFDHNTFTNLIVFLLVSLVLVSKIFTGFYSYDKDSSISIISGWITWDGSCTYFLSCDTWNTSCTLKQPRQLGRVDLNSLKLKIDLY